MVLEATYGWYWAADVLAELGATVHLAHPLGVKAFAYRRVKNDDRDAADLADSAADGPAAGGVDRAAGDPGAARAGPAPGQAGASADQSALPGARGAGQARCAVSVSDLFGVEGVEAAGRAGAAAGVRGTGSTRCGG